jgi:hypothetical protein
MRFLTKGLLGPAGILFIALFAANEAYAVAAFTRQTGMSCNSCHTLHGAPTPNFTFTGKKFNAMGYRLPGRPHHTQERTKEQGTPDDLGEFLTMLPTTFSGRMQYSPYQKSKGPTATDWGEATSNPTSRLAFFPFLGPIGNHFGVWTEFYIVPFTSEDNEWGIADTSYEEFDFRYIINPENMDYTIGLAFNNQSIYELFGFGPYPGLPSYLNRGVIGGYTHPNKGTLSAYGWMYDRWIWALGVNTGDTNMGWDENNFLGFFGYALRNRNDNELWINIAARTGSDVMPLVTANGAQASSRSFQYRDAIGGISNTRRPPGDPCPGVAGRRPAGSCAYLAEEIDDATSVDIEVRWGGQNVGSFFGSQGTTGPWSFETVARVGFNSEDYIDGAKAKRNTWGIQTVIGYKHTYYIKPSIQDSFTYEFTDLAGTKYDIDTKISWNLTLAYKPVENFLIYLAYSNNQSNSLTGSANTGRVINLTADISF